MTFGPLVAAGWLHDHIDDRDIRVIDFRWYLQHRNGHDEYLRSHIPGAVFVDLDAVTGAGAGRHPLPTAAQFEAEMRKAGVRSGTRVVVYDDTVGSVAARLWFLLRYFGHEAQAVLDGGLQAWGEPLDAGVPKVESGDFRAREPDPSLVLDFEAVRTLRGVPLIDARAAERYRGDVEPIDPKAGHIPGALSAPLGESLGPDGRFKSPDELRRRYRELGAENGAVFYCGSGVNATHHLLAMEVAGLPNARLYAGSWSDWSNRDAPVATGSAP
ncbi:MAG: sulfurtransferase [Chloroflexi bacterium]|nr:MAG: sulfurtransferase [Chloroflexota bacterium]